VACRRGHGRRNGLLLGAEIIPVYNNQNFNESRGLLFTNLIPLTHTGVYADYHYIGTGDIGGAVDEESVKLLEAMVSKSEAVIPPPGFGRGGRGAPDTQTPPPAPNPPVKMGDGPVHVIAATADQMFLDIKPEMTSRMPRYKGDLELINHSAGSLSVVWSSRVGIFPSGVTTAKKSKRPSRSPKSGIVVAPMI